MSKEQIKALAADMKVFMNHIYEYQKGVRSLVLYTFNGTYRPFVEQRLANSHIDYFILPAGNETLNLFFGRKECIEACRFLVDRPLYQLNPEEDFILGAMLGYDINAQCKRYCSRKRRCGNCRHAMQVQ
jgi:hypothetical protein